MRKRKRQRAKVTEADANPVIGYLLVDAHARVFDPTGRGVDPAYGSAAKALQAAGLGRAARGLRAAPLYLGGVLNVLWGDVGDIQLDGEAAQQFVRACQRRRLAYDAQRARQIRGDEAAPVYSSRAILRATRG